MAWPAFAGARQLAPASTAPALASVPVAGVSLQGATGLVHGRATLSEHAGITTAKKPASLELQRGGSLLLCAHSSLRLARDASARTEGAASDAGLALSLDHRGLEARYKAGIYPDVLVMGGLQFLISGPGQADFKVSSDASGTACVDNGGRNAPFLTAKSMATGQVRRLRPGQHVLFLHGALDKMTEGTAQICGCAAASEDAPQLQTDTGHLAAALSDFPGEPLRPAIGTGRAQVGNVPRSGLQRGSAITRVPSTRPTLVTRFALMIKRLTHPQARQPIFALFPHPSHKVRGMDSWLETDVLIMIFAVAFTITLSLAIQAAFFIALFVLARKKLQKLLWAAEDVKDAAAPATGEAQLLLREVRQLVRQAAQQSTKNGTALPKETGANVQSTRKPARALPAAEVPGEVRPARRTSRAAGSNARRGTASPEQDDPARRLVDVYPERDAQGFTPPSDAGEAGAAITTSASSRPLRE